ncbi:hypothetical protein [Brevibacillus sp. SYSU BS000544]|uniref:hypothetical protein n=1 Tax=Brevibacillus sp. SYSU BS000544 TaxID=3416443 RepID=UPI003CE45EAE
MKFWKCCFLFIFLQIFILPSSIAAPAPSDTIITITNKNKLELNKKVNVKAVTPIDGEIVKSSFRYTVDSQKYWDIENAKTMQIGSKYYTYGSFIPEESGEYYIHFTMTMKDSKGKQWISVGGISVKILDYAILDVMSNPIEATVYDDQDVYISVRYQADNNLNIDLRRMGYLPIMRKSSQNMIKRPDTIQN